MAVLTRRPLSLERCQAPAESRGNGRGNNFPTPETSAKNSAASPPRCLPAWSGVQDQRCPRNRLRRHHAACQRGAVFKTRDVAKSAASPPRCLPAWSGVQDQRCREIGCLATTLLASVERCSRPEMSTKSAASPPRCLPAWSGVQDQRCREIGCFAATLLASVERCSRPEMSRNRLPRHHAACQRGAVFKLLDAVRDRKAGCEHGSTLASSVVAKEVARRGDGWL